MGADFPSDGFPQFNRKYGEQLPDGTWQIPARWQAGLSNVCYCLVPGVQLVSE